MIQGSLRWAGLIALAFLLAAAAVIGGIGKPERPDVTLAGLPIGSDTRKVAELQDELGGEGAQSAVVLFARDGALEDRDLGYVERWAASQPGAGRPVPSEDGTAAIVPVTLDYGDAAEAADLVDQLRTDLRDGVRETVADDRLTEGLTAQVTGPAAIAGDLASVFDGADLRLLLATACIVALLLVVTYRSPVLWLIPLTIVGVADQAAGVLATRVLDAAGMGWDGSTTGILSVLVFGAATDYALLLISRYRDELRLTEDRRAAMARAVARTAEAVLSSATTVVLGLLALLLSLFESTRSLGVACAVGVVVAAFTALVALPAALVVFGRWVFWPRVPRVDSEALVDRPSLWHRVGQAVAARPGTVTVLVLAGLAVSSVGALRIETGLTAADQFLDKPEAIVAGERLAESFPAGAEPTVVLTRDDAREVTQTAAGVPGVAAAQPTREDGDLTEIRVVLDTDDTDDGAGGAGDAGHGEAAQETVLALRDALAQTPDTWVGGPTAELIDEADATARDRRVIIPVILAVVLLGLGLILRSVVAPLILVSTVLATYVASLGIAWVIFTRVFGFERLDSGAPLIAFVFSVALGVDYNIFLITRAKQEIAAGHGPRAGILRALAATGGVITSAGILLAAVFAVLGVLPLVVLAQVGVIICVGVLLDTLIVRTLLVPATALVLGEAFWWPRRLG